MPKKNFKELRAKMSPESQARVAAKTKAMSLALDLAELRAHAGGITQAQVAELLEITQSAVSQLEQREDILLSTLAEYVAALGGELELVARFKGRTDVRVSRFKETRKQLAR